MIRYRSYDGFVFLYAFDLNELNGGDLRRGLCAGIAKSRLNQHRGRA